MAAKLGRDAIGIELNPEYVEMSRKRIVGELGMLVEMVIDMKESTFITKVSPPSAPAAASA